MTWRKISQALGLDEGGAVRTALERVWPARGSNGGRGLEPRSGGVRSETFAAAFVALAAKLSKSDGVALKIEADTFERLFKATAEDAARIRQLFNLARQDVAGFESYAGKVARELAGAPDLKRDVFNALLAIAAADGVLHEAEDLYLAAVASRFGYSPIEYRALRAQIVHDADEPYSVLGVLPSISNQELKAHHRRLVRENHPDALIGHGVPKEFRDLAEKKLAAINGAYAAIAKERGL